MNLCHVVFVTLISVADPDPDPKGHPDPIPVKNGSGSLVHKQTPITLLFSIYIIMSKIQFCQNIFFYF